MKKLITILVVAIMATSVTFAQSSTHNESETASAKFTTTVITPLSWNNPDDVDLGKVTNGDIKTFASSEQPAITFTLTGEAGYEVSVTTSGPESEVEGVSLTGSWDNETDDYTLDGATGTADFTYTCTAVDASSHTLSDNTPDDLTFTVGVSAVYSGL